MKENAAFCKFRSPTFVFQEHILEEKVMRHLNDGAFSLNYVFMARMIRLDFGVIYAIDVNRSIPLLLTHEGDLSSRLTRGSFYANQILPTRLFHNYVILCHP